MIKLNESFQRIQEKINLNGLNLDSEKDIKTLIMNFSDVVFPEITDVINIIFKCGNPEFAPFTVEFVTDNMGFHTLKNIVMTTIEMNDLGDAVLPFLKDSVLPLMKASIKRNIAETLKKTRKKG